jgi:hypothetical protein
MLAVMRRLGVLTVLVSLVLAGCGGSSSSTSSTSSPTAGSTSAAATSSAPSTSAPATTSATSTTTAGTPASSTSTTTAGTPASSTSTTTPGPDTDVHLPAKFTIRAGGVLSPPVVAAPKHTTIVLTVRAQDGRHHTLALATPRAHTVAVEPGRATQLMLKGLPNGTYVVKVDGAVRGRLIVGAAPGP